MEEARDRNDDEPETPRTSLNPRPMLTPPRLVQVTTQNGNQNEGDEADMQQTTSHQINIDDAVIQLERDSERLHIPQNENSSSTIVFNTQTPSELNFPIMRQSLSSSSTSTGMSQVTSPSDWNMSLNRETVRRGRRRRASSFDNSIPIPRISLRPRFSRHSDSANNSNVPGNEPGNQQSSQSNIINGESLLYSNFAAHGDDCNCAQCSTNRLPFFDATARHPPGARIRPRNRRHFRHNTYGGSDASTDVFAEALQGDSLDNFSFALSPQFENIDLSNHSSSSTHNDHSNGVVSIVHNPFELSSIEASLPPAAMAFAPPSDVNSTSTRGRRNASHQTSSSSTTASTVIPRPIPRPQPPLGDSHPIPHPLLGHTRSKAQVASTANVNHSAAATSTASPSLGTPTCTCTISTSSVSAFDQTSPPQWQDHNFSPGTSSDSMVFEGLKNEPSPLPPKTATSFNPMYTIQSGVNAPSTTQVKNDDTQILALDRDTKRDGKSKSISAVDNNTKENASNFPFDEVIFHDNSSDHSAQLPHDEYAEKKKDST